MIQKQHSNFLKSSNKVHEYVTEAHFVGCAPSESFVLLVLLVEYTYLNMSPYTGVVA